MPPGTYKVSADAKGFDRASSAAFKVDINENVTTNLTVKVAGSSQTIQVEARSQAIQTEDAETGQFGGRLNKGSSFNVKHVPQAPKPAGVDRFFQQTGAAG